MKKKHIYIKPMAIVIAAENENLLEASPNIGYKGEDYNFHKEGGELIEEGGEWNGATPAKYHDVWDIWS